MEELIPWIVFVRPKIIHPYKRRVKGETQEKLAMWRLEIRELEGDHSKGIR